MSSINKNQLKYWIGFTKIPSIGPARFNKLRKAFTSLEETWNAPITRLSEIGLGEHSIAEFIRLRRDIDLDEAITQVEKEGLSVVTIDDEDYPKLLKEIHLPPALLYYRGTLPSADDFLLAVVGSRKYSEYGQQVCGQIVRELSRNKLTIVSGLALGIDALAHEATLMTQGKTIGILGSGADKNSIYPHSNRHLSEKIIQSGGCVISEHPIGMPGLAHNFPRRNRIISGITLGTLVVEETEKSGALITARFALEQNREVFAVPSNITNQNAKGTNNLIKMGARPVTEASDVLDELNLKQAVEYTAAKEVTPDTAEEAKLLDHLKLEPMHVDDLGRLTNLPANAINATLTLMEMKGKVRHLGAMKYVLAR